MPVRKPQVAGTFYPAEAAQLQNFCHSHLSPVSPSIPARAVILPHAGYVYSGDTACRVLAQVDIPERNLLIGPNHRGLGSDFALFPEGEWETPLGRVSIDSELAAHLLESSPELRADTAAHEFEHSLEVEIPLLQTRNPRLQIAPLIVGTLDIELAREVALAMGQMLASLSSPPLLVISNDMNHYESDDAARRKDQYALDAIENLDEEALVKAVRQHRITMCGFVPVFMLLVMKNFLGIRRATLVDYRTSADATGDKSRVVGYAGFIFQ